MKFTPSALNTYTFFKLPSVWWTGIRVIHIDTTSCIAKVKHRWVNQNPFDSMFWAVQGMAAELTTGVLVMKAIAKRGRKISMLVLHNRASFTKKARGMLTFECDQGELVDRTVSQLLDSGKPQTVWLKSSGIDAQGDIVSTFEFEWTVALKKQL